MTTAQLQRTATKHQPRRIALFDRTQQRDPIGLGHRLDGGDQRLVERA